MINITQDKNRDIAKELDDATKQNNADSKAEDIKNQQSNSIVNGEKVNNYSFSGSASSGSDVQSQSNGQAQGLGLGLGNIAFPQALPVANGYTNMPNQQGNINKNIGQGLGNLGAYGWNKNLGNNDIKSEKDYKISAGAELI